MASIDPSRMRCASHGEWVHQFEIWGNVRADLVKRTRLGRQETQISSARHIFLMNVVGVAREGEDFIDGRRVSFSARPPGSLVYIPAHSEWRGWDDGDQIASYLLVSVEKGFAERILGSPAGNQLAELPPSLGFRDAAMEVALQSIIRELRNPDPMSITMVESQAAQLFVRLFRRSGAGRGQVRGGLSPFDMKRVTAILKGPVDARPSLTDLAREFDLSPTHFCRAFKQSTGITPHAYLSQYRFARAIDMLRFSKSTATEIALECGFGSSSNFSVAFKRAFGQSPTEFRRAWRR